MGLSNIAALSVLTTLGLALTGCLWLERRTPPRTGRRIIQALLLAAAPIAAWLAYPSDPRAWSLERAVLYFVAPAPELFNLLGNTLTGSVLFGLFWLGVYAARKPRSRKR